MEGLSLIILSLDRLLLLWAELRAMLALEPRFDKSGFLGSGLRGEIFSVIVSRVVLLVLRGIGCGSLGKEIWGLDLGWDRLGLSLEVEPVRSGMGRGFVRPGLTGRPLVRPGLTGRPLVRPGLILLFLSLVKELETFTPLRGLGLGCWELDVGGGGARVSSEFFFEGISKAFFDVWRLLCCCWLARSGPLFLFGGDLRKSWPLLVKNPPFPVPLPGI